jgi:DNA-binding XRE family transcriptional regulator
MARALTGCSRQELYEKVGIATSTIDTWESGRVELTEKSAIRVCAALKQVGIYCSCEWLLTGDGIPPRIMDDLEKSMLSIEKSHETESSEISASSKIKKIPVFLNEDIRQELSFFLSLHKNSLFHIVKNDFLNSRYKIGDCVAGIEGNLTNLIGRTIIAVLNDEKMVLCKLVAHLNNESYIFLSRDKPNEKANISKAAEVVWHRMIKQFS